MWRSIQFKVDEAGFFLEQMSKDLVPPELRPDAPPHLPAIAMTGTIVAHPWQRRFYYHLDAFLAAARSVPEIIMFQFGVDTKVPANWVTSLPQPKPTNRQQFANQFGPIIQRKQHPVSKARNITIHRAGTSDVEFALVDPWRNVHEGGPTTHVDDAITAPVNGWESILAENEMGKTTLVGFRFENELLRRIDAYGKHLEGETPGLKLARVDVVRIFLMRALSQVEEPEGSRKQRQ